MVSSRGAARALLAGLVAASAHALGASPAPPTPQALQSAAVDLFASGLELPLSLALRYWFGRPRTASAFGAAAARELAYGVYAAFGGIVLVIVIEIVGFIRFLYS